MITHEPRGAHRLWARLRAKPGRYPARFVALAAKAAGKYGLSEAEHHEFVDFYRAAFGDHAVENAWRRKPTGD